MYQNRIQYFADILILLGLIVICASVMTGIGILVSAGTFHLGIMETLSRMQDTSNPENIGILKLINVFSTFGAWLLSAYILILIRGKKVFQYWQLNSSNCSKIWVYMPLIFISVIILSAFFLNLNHAIHFPDFLKSWIENTKKTESLMGHFLAMNTTKDLILNLLIVAVAPAVFEEIFFRGTLQKLIIGFTGNMHLGVVITSFIFAAIHMNAIQIIPMFFIALVLGYLYQFTQSIWPNILLHFLNNAMAVIGLYYQNKHPIAKQITDDSIQMPYYVTIFAFATLAFIFFQVYNNYKKKILINE